MKVKDKIINKKTLIITLCVCTLLLAGGVSTYAYLTAKTAGITNTFEYGKVSCNITEDFDGTTKSNVCVQNTGNVDARVRCMIIVNWKNNAGQVCPKAPVQGQDYNMSIGSGWTGSNGIYTYGEVVKPNTSTTALITSCTEVKSKAPNGYRLSVEILADAIQSDPVDAKTEAWGN